MGSRRIAIAAVAALAVLAAAYVGSPWWVTMRMRKAAEAGEGERVAAYVDYPTLRENLTAQIRANMHAEPPEAEQDASPLAGFGRAILGSIAGVAVEAMVTPERVAHLVTNGGAKPRGEVERRRRYESPNVF